MPSKKPLIQGRRSLQVKLPAHRAGLPGQAVASRMRANEISFFIVPLDPASKAGLAGYLPVKRKRAFFKGIQVSTKNQE
jgi:hypothetical protein